MATITSAQSGAWSATATWVGGVVPVDGSDVVIAAGHSVLMDVEQSAMTGMMSVTVQGHATTPAMLYWADGTSGYLKIRTGYNLVGTTGTLKGRILANSDGTWGNTGALAFANKAVIDLQGTSQINASYLDMQLYCTEPTNKYVRTYGSKITVTADASADTFGAIAHGLTNTTPVMFQSSGTLPAPILADTLYYVVSTAANTFQVALVSGGSAIDLTSAGSGTIEVYTGHTNTSTAVMNVLDDVTADTPWTTTDGHDAVVLADAGPADYDQQRLALSAIAATTVTLSANVDSAQYPGARITLSSRNVSIRSAGTSGSQSIITTLTGGVLGCEIKNTAGQLIGVTTFYGYALNSSNNNTISGTISGCSSALNSSNNNTISGTISGCNYAIYNSSNNNTISGTISGCGYALSSSNNNTISGTISGCSYALNSSNNNTISGTISGCSYALNISTNNTVSGTISGCSYTVRSVTADSATFHNASHAVPVTWYARNTANSRARYKFENYNRIDGSHRVEDMFGDIIKVQCGSGSPVPATDPDSGTGYCLECSNIQSNCSASNPLQIVENLRVWVGAGAHTIRFKTQNTFASGLASGETRLTAEYLTSGNVPAIATSNTTAMTTVTDWSQGIQVSFTSAVDGWVTLNMYLEKYEAGSPELYVWPIPVVS